MSDDHRQLTLPFRHAPSLAADDFLVAPCNADAVAWFDRWPDWPAPAMVLHGPRGSGKSHLLEIFIARTGADRWPAVGAIAETTCDTPRLPPLAVDDGPAALAAAGEEAFLHAYNWRIERGGTLFITAARPPAHWAIALPDLRSRLAAAFVAGIAEPDDAVLRAMAVKQFRDRRLAVDDALLDYLIARTERSFAAIADLVAALDEASLRWQRPVTVALAHRVLAGGRE